MNVKTTNPRPLRGPLPLVALLLSSCLSSFLCPALAQDPSKFQDDLFVQAADYSKSHSGHAVLIQHQGKILYERYDNWGADTPHMLASGTKSFSGVLAMFAVQDGLLELDEPVSKTIDSWKDDPKKSKITIRHLLTLCSGLDPADAAFPNRNAGLLNRNPILSQRQNRIARQDQAQGLSKLATGNWFADSLHVPMKYQPGQKFDYGPSHFYVFGELINRKLQNQTQIQAKTFEQYAKLRILDPLGIQVGRWGKDASGNVNIPGGMMLTARNWAKFGQFVLDKGSIKKTETVNLLKEDLLMQCFEPSATNNKYGLTWWLNGVDGPADSGLSDNDSPSEAPTSNLRDRVREESLLREADTDIRQNGTPLKVYMAAGLGKQRLYVIPKHDLVVVRFAEPSSQGARFQNDDFMKPILEALVSEKP
ncbi:MAG: serine hydrolase domain-containing protein [Pirellula sp.]